jgi:ferredoxin
MPQVTAQGKVFTCEIGANLRQVLLEHGVDLYNGNAKFINCMSIGTCGTFAVQIEGNVSVANWNEFNHFCISLPATHHVLGWRDVTKKQNELWINGTEIKR